MPNKLVNVGGTMLAVQLQCRKCPAMYGVRYDATRSWFARATLYWVCLECGGTMTLNPISCADTDCQGAYVMGSCAGMARPIPPPAETVAAYERDIIAWKRSVPKGGTASDSYKDDMAEWNAEEPAPLRRQYYECGVCGQELHEAGACSRTSVLICNQCGHQPPPLCDLPGPDKPPLAEIPLSARRPEVGYKTTTELLANPWPTQHRTDAPEDDTDRLHLRHGTGRLHGPYADVESTGQLNKFGE
jgi:hypothetical protein